MRSAQAAGQVAFAKKSARHMNDPVSVGGGDRAAPQFANTVYPIGTDRAERHFT
jgi:hypothetical protein